MNSPDECGGRFAAGVGGKEPFISRGRGKEEGGRRGGREVVREWKRKGGEEGRRGGEERGIEKE